MAYSYDNGSLGRRIFHPRAGFTSIRGLGDAAYDQAMAAYQQAHAAWVTANANYQNQMKGWAAGEANKAAGYASSQASYAAQMAAINAVKQKLQAQGVVFQSDFLGCVYPAQRDAWVNQCNAMSATVKGLGASTPTGSPCLLAQLPLCPLPTPPVPPVPAPQPAPPGPEPLPPAAPPPVVTDSLIPTPPSAIDPVLTPTAPTTKSGGMMTSGLILLVVAGSGYALYRTLKKPKKA